MRVVHYEIAGYTVAIAIAKQRGEKEIVATLTETLKEEQNTAKLILNASKKVLKEAGAEEDEDEEDKDSKPKSPKEQQSEQESEQDEADAVKQLNAGPAAGKKSGKGKKK